MSEAEDNPAQEEDSPQAEVKPTPVRPPIKKPPTKPVSEKPPENKVVKLLERNPLGMTLPEMAGGTRQLKKIRTLRPILGDAIRSGVVMPVSQRAGHTVYRLVKFLGPR
jgi:hypothetical protein